MTSDWLSSDIVWRLGWTLVHSVWQILLVGGLFGLLLALAARRSAALRYWIATSGLVCAYVPLIATFALVDSQAEPALEIASSPGREHLLAEPDRNSAPPAPTPPEPLADETRVEVTQAAELPAQQPPFWSVHALQAAFGPWLPWFVSAWCGGVALLAVWNVGGWIRVQRIRSQGTAPASDFVLERVRELARRLRVHQPVRVAMSVLVDVPLVIGWLRPVILLPASLVSGLSTAQLDAILTHELAHVKRRDYLVNLFQLFTETLLFYHPVIWLLSRHIRTEREFCCDDATIAAGSERSVFVEALAAVESSRMLPAQMLSMAGSKPGMSLRRARRIMRSANPPRSSGVAGVSVLLLLVTVLSVAGLFRSPANATDAPEARGDIVDTSQLPPLDLARFRLDIRHYGESDKPFYNATFYTGDVQTPAAPNQIVSQIDGSQRLRLAQILRWLRESQYFLHAQPNDLPGDGEQGYLLQVTSGDDIWTEDLGWGLGMLLRLDSLRAAFDWQPETSLIDVQAPAPIDPLIGRLSGLRREWTRSNASNGMESQLSTERQSFAAGRSIPVRLAFKNTSDTNREFTSHYVSMRETKHNYLFQFDIYDPFGRNVPYLGGFAQFRVSPKTLRPGESDGFDFDLARSHYLRRPGIHTIIHRDSVGRHSNAIGINITRSDVDDGDPIGRLLPLIRGPWIMVADPILRTTLRPGANFEAVPGRSIRFEYRPRDGSLSDVRLVFLWLTTERAKERPANETRLSSAGPPSRYVGQVDRWHLYIHEGEDTRQLWPTMLIDLKGALAQDRSRPTNAEWNASLDAIGRLAARLNAPENRMWVNGASPAISLSRTASVDEVVQRAVGASTFGERGERITTFKILAARDPKLQTPGHEDCRAVLIHSNLGQKILLYKHYGESSLWTRFFDVPKEQAAVNSPPASVADEVYRALHEQCREFVAQSAPSAQRETLAVAVETLSRRLPHLVQVLVTRSGDADSEPRVVLNWLRDGHTPQFQDMILKAATAPQLMRRTNGHSYVLAESLLPVDSQGPEGPQIRTVFIDDRHGPWGASNQGVQLRLRSAKTQWSMSETPTFSLDIRNANHQPIAHWDHHGFCEIQVDGVWYVPNTFAISTFGVTLPPGATSATKIQLNLDTEQAKNSVGGWVTKQGRRRLALAPGQHTLRVAVRTIQGYEIKQPPSLASTFEVTPVSNLMAFSVHKTVHPPLPPRPAGVQQLTTAAPQGVFAQAGAHQQTVVEIKDGQFRFWFSSDVALKPPRTYPLAGSYSMRGRTLLLQHALIPDALSEWAFHKIKGELRLCTPDAIEAHESDGTIETYGILKPTSQSAEDAWATRGLRVELTGGAHWKTGEVPSFNINIRNAGDRPFALGATQPDHRLDFDGERYFWEGPHNTPEVRLGIGDSRRIAFTIDEQTWHRETDLPVKSKGRLRIRPGEHRVRAVLTLFDIKSNTKRTAYSNSVDMEVVASGQHEENLIKNGSFEKPVVGALPWRAHGVGPLAGWHVKSGTVDVVGRYWRAADGGQSLDLSGLQGRPGLIYQDITTTKGAYHRLFFWAAANPEPDDIKNPKRLTVFWGDREVAAVELDAANRDFKNVGWKLYQYTLLAEQPVTRVAFRSETSTPCGPILDDIAVICLEGD